MKDIAACLTPPGTGAVATVAVRGPNAWEVVRGLWLGKTALPAEPVLSRLWPGRLGDDLADEVVVAIKAVQPVPWVEVHTHGGREVVRALLTALMVRGMEVISWQEFERNTGGALRTAATAALASAATARTAAILLDQREGAFLKAVTEARDALSREDSSTGVRVADLARHAALGRHLTAPWRVAVAGPPNVGKSSLVNALAGFARCVVSPTPGTTRDIVGVTVAVEGWPVELLDTAGVREAQGVEATGVEQAQEVAAKADLCLWLHDASTPPMPAPSERFRCVITKIDLPAAWDLDAGAAIRVSARTGEGMQELCAALVRWLVPEPPVAGEAVPFTPELAEAMELARDHVTARRLDLAEEVLRLAACGLAKQAR